MCLLCLNYDVLLCVYMINSVCVCVLPAPSFDQEDVIDDFIGPLPPKPDSASTEVST